jgi:hypothetical protein
VQKVATGFSQAHEEAESYNAHKCTELCRAFVLIILLAQLVSIQQMGIWSDIKPKAKRKHPWVFAQYLETPSERADGQWYIAFLFRDLHRTMFGIHEFVGRLPHDKDLRHMATRVVVDGAYRKSMLSDRAELPKWWKRH